MCLWLRVYECMPSGEKGGMYACVKMLKLADQICKRQNLFNEKERIMADAET